MLDYNITFTHMLIPSNEDAYKITYTKGQVKPLMRQNKLLRKLKNCNKSMMSSTNTIGIPIMI
jgi:hypothetical protein